METKPLRLGSATWGFAERADPLTIPAKVNASERFAQNEARGPLGGPQPGHRKRGPSEVAPAGGAMSIATARPRSSAG